MTGTGTQTDPYIVDNWDDFVSVVVEDGVYIEFDENAENKIIDMNDVASEGLTETIETGANIYINGNNWTIRNLYLKESSNFIKTGSSAQWCKIQHLNFLNFYAINSNVFGGGIILKYCMVSGVMYSNTSGSSVKYLFNGMKQISSYSSFNVKFLGTPLLALYVSYNSTKNCFENCIFKFDGSSSSISGESYSFVVKNCKIIGKNPFASFCISPDSQLSVIDFNSDTTVSLNNTSSNEGKNLINIDKISENATISGPFYQLTTEQMSNSTYLASIDFPIGVD